MKIRNFFLSLLIVLLNSCATLEIQSDYQEDSPLPINPQIKISDTAGDKKINRGQILVTQSNNNPQIGNRFKIAILLPLSGKNKKIGQSILNAINISLFNNDRKSKIELIIFDNQSSKYKTKKAIKEIADNGIRIVIGPVFSSSVEAALKIAQENDISMISFSNNSDLMNKKGLFLAGFSLEQELERVISYMINNNRNNFSIIAPNNRYGVRMAKILRKITTAKDANFISSQFYLKNKKDFSKVTKTILNSYIAPVNMEDFQEELNLIEDEEERKLRELEIIAEHKIYTDTILIADNLTKSSQIVESLQNANIEGRNLQIIGTNHWNSNKAFLYPGLYGSVFSAPDNKYYNLFKEKYLNTYKEEPIRISSIGYDIAAFVIDLSYKIKKYNNINQQIVNYNKKRGFKGIDGAFRFLPNGLIQRNLAILEIVDREIITIDKSSGRFIKY